MKRTLRFFPIYALLVLVTASVALAAEPIQLFDGKTLDGWSCYLVDPDVKCADVWSVKDGLLYCKGEPMGYLHTKKKYENFKLVVEWRWPEGVKPTNSGVLMRIIGDPQALPKCLEAQLMHGKAGDLYGFHEFQIDGAADRRSEGESPMAGKLIGVKKMCDAENPAGEWNRYEIVLDGGKLTAKINDKLVNEASDCQQVPGFIGLQSEGGPIEFRKVELTPLEK